MPKIKKLETKAEEITSEVVELAQSEIPVVETKENRNQDRGQTTSTYKKSKKVCLFCSSEKEPTYTDTSALRKYMSDRFRIIPRAKSGVCSKHQRRVTREIKHARHLSLLPFVASV